MSDGDERWWGREGRGWRGTESWYVCLMDGEAEEVGRKEGCGEG